MTMSPVTSTSSDTPPASSSAQPVAKRRARSRVRRADIRRFIKSIVGDDFHAKRVLSLANGVSGAIHGAALAIHAIGQGLAQAQGLNPKHAVKQVDRLLSNAGLSMEDFFARWVPFVVGSRAEVVLALDLTEFDGDDQSTIALHLVSSHGRATALLWKTVVKSELQGWRNAHEDGLLSRFAQVRPETLTRATVLADRGFGDQKLYAFLATLGLDYVIRFRGVVHVEAAEGQCQPAADWVPASGRPRLLRGARVTCNKAPVAAVVCVHARGMKDPWCLASSRGDLPATAIVKLYGKRFQIEESFRDSKDARYGLGLSATHVRTPIRRDRLLLLATIAQALLTLLGAAAEKVGLDRMLKVNTVKERTHSLFRQGSFWYGAIPAMPAQRLRALMEAFGALIAAQPLFVGVFGLL